METDAMPTSDHAAPCPPATTTDPSPGAPRSARRPTITTTEDRREDREAKAIAAALAARPRRRCRLLYPDE